MKIDTLPEETICRRLPDLLDPADAALFEAERERTFPAVSTKTVTGDFFPDGWEGDGIGWKSLLKRLLVRTTTRALTFVPGSGRRPLIATDRFSNGYFHWVTETLPRLWWLRQQLAGLELLLPAFASRFAYMAESLAVFPDLAYRITAPGTRWKLTGALLVPPVAPGGNFRPDLIRQVGEAWRLRTIPQKPFRKLYISRSRAARRRIANEVDVVSVLEARGFETVHLEQKPFADQVRLLAEATHLVSNHGAGLTNMLFMTPGSRVTEIRMKGDAHNNCYFSLARALGLDYSYRLGDPVGEGPSAHTADLWVDPKALL